MRREPTRTPPEPTRTDPSAPRTRRRSTRMPKMQWSPTRERTQREIPQTPPHLLARAGPPFAQQAIPIRIPRAAGPAAAACKHAREPVRRTDAVGRIGRSGARARGTRWSACPVKPPATRSRAGRATPARIRGPALAPTRAPGERGAPLVRAAELRRSACPITGGAADRASGSGVITTPAHGRATAPPATDLAAVETLIA
jgi:hypothetical protein